MLIKKQYKFYAAHRNQFLQDKCKNIHGHTYRVWFHFDVTAQAGNDVTTLFGDFDAKIEPLIKELDHSMLMHVDDPLVKHLQSMHELKFFWMNRPTSVENLCRVLFGVVLQMFANLVAVEVQETDSSTVIFERSDYFS